MIAASEALMLAKRLKMDLKKVHEIMKNASGNSWALSTYTPLPNLTDGVPSNNKYRPGFSAAMMTKDLKLANDAAKSVNASTPLGKHALDIFNEFCEGGDSETDYSGISKKIGGDDEAVDLARPLMDIMGQKILHAGPQGSGVGVKICNNMSLGISMIAASEALMLAKRLKMDLKKVHEIMKNASGNNWALSTYTPLPNLTDGVPSNNKYRPGFSVGMMSKDLKLAIESAKEVNANTPLGSKANDIYNKFCEEGHSNKDFSAISKVVGGDAWDYEIDD